MVNRCVIYSESRGVWLGNNEWTRDAGRTPVHQLRYPCWSEERVKLMIKDVCDIAGLADVRAVPIEVRKNRDGCKFLTYSEVVGTGLLAVVEVPA